MSLINDALKKAQRSRSADPGDLAPSSGGGGRIAKRGQPLSANSIILYASGALVLFVLAVVGAVYLLNRPASPAPAVDRATPTPIAAASEAGSPLIVPPVISFPPPAAAAPEKLPPMANTPATVPIEPTPVPPKPASPPDERVHRYLDELHVTAVRVQPGNESRVMINERVYRVNDIVDRPLALRLTKVETDHLTFTDANGVDYVKYF